jgi:hypothetical protein
VSEVVCYLSGIRPIDTRLVIFVYVGIVLDPSDWIGLDWIGLDWIGLDWIGLDWIGLDWIGLDWIGLDWIGLDWILYCIVSYGLRASYRFVYYYRSVGVIELS